MQEAWSVRERGKSRDEELMPGGEKERKEKLQSCLVQLRITCDVVLL